MNKVKKELDLDLALEQIAKKLKPVSKLNDDADYQTPAESCGSHGCPSE